MRWNVSNSTLRLYEGTRTTTWRPFNDLDPSKRHQLLDDLYGVAQELHGKFFAVVVRKLI